MYQGKVCHNGGFIFPENSEELQDSIARKTLPHFLYNITITYYYSTDFNY